MMFVVEATHNVCCMEEQVNIAYSVVLTSTIFYIQHMKHLRVSG